jgi:antitoxin Phd
MKTWPVQDAEARFREMLEDCLKHGPQLVTMHGSEAAVLVPIEEWRRLNGVPARTLKDLLHSDEPRGERILPIGRRRRRAIPRFD